MKTIYIPYIIGLLLVTIESSKAQNLNVGVFAGYDRTIIDQPKLSPNQLGTGYKPVNSFNTNCYISYKSKSIWGLSLEPGYIIKGTKFGAGGSSRHEFKYLQFPLLMDIYFLKKFNVSIGPEFSYMFSARAINPGPGNTVDESDHYNKKFELSGFIGINYMIFKNIGLGLGYNHGLTYIYKLPWGTISNPMEGSSYQYNQYWQFRICYKIHSFDLKKNKDS